MKEAITAIDTARLSCLGVGYRTSEHFLLEEGYLGENRHLEAVNTHSPNHETIICTAVVCLAPPSFRKP